MLTSSITSGLFGSNSTAAFMVRSLFVCFVFSAASSVELNDAAYHLAGLHVGKAFVDLLELDLGGDPVVEMQLAAEVKLDQPRHVLAEVVRAHRRALHALLAQEVGAVQFDLGAERDHADDGGNTTGAEHGKRLLRGDLGAEHLERILHA